MHVRESSVMYLTYPVAFEPESVRFSLSDQVSDPDAIWRPKELSLEDWLPSVVELLRNTGEDMQRATLWELHRRSLESAQVVGAGSETEWQLTVESLQISFQLEEVQLAVFPQGVALLSLRIRPLSDEVPTWLNLLHHARYARRFGTILRLRRRVGFDPDTGNTQWHDFFPPIAGGLQEHPDGQGQLADFLDGLLRSTRCADQAARPWKEVFVPGQLIPFVALFLDQVPPAERDAILYRVQHFYSAEQGLPLAGSELHEPGQRWTFAKNQTFLFAMDGTAFVAFDAPQTPFFQSTLPGQLSRQYWLLFQLALYQRFALISILERISRGWNSMAQSADEQHLQVLNRTRGQFLRFIAGGYHAQVSQQPRQHACYQKWQEEFQIPELYVRAREAIDRLQDWVSQDSGEQLRWEVQHLQLRLCQIASLLGPPALALSFCGIVGWTRPWMAATALVTALLLGWGLWHFLVQSNRRRSWWQKGRLGSA